MVLTYAYCNVSVMPVRREPAHRAEQINQLLFGEKAEVIEIDNKEWAHIKGEWDGYKGWCKASQLKLITKKEYRKETKYTTATHTDKLIFEQSEIILPLGSELADIKGGKITQLNEIGKFKGKKSIISTALINCDTVKAAALLYMNAPYQWGGRSIAGIDCSGLSQMAYKLCNKVLPRDAAQQAKEGELVDFLQHSKCGDLAFFDNADGKIVHVGILIDELTIIHATDTSGRVVCDRIDQGGIISVSMKKRTHNLRMVRRYF